MATESAEGSTPTLATATPLASEPVSETFATALASVRAAWRVDRLSFARSARLSVKTVQRWERNGVHPRALQAQQLLLLVAKHDHPSAVRLARALGIAAPADPSPPPSPPPTPEAAPEPAPAPPPPIPSELVVDPVEVALFRAAESLGISPAALRPTLARFLGHLAALGVGPADARARIAVADCRLHASSIQ